MDTFVNIIKKCPQVQIKIDDMLDSYIRLPYIYQSITAYDTLIRNVIPKKCSN